MRTALRSVLAAALWLLFMSIPATAASVVDAVPDPSRQVMAEAVTTAHLAATGETAPESETSSGEGTGGEGSSIFSGESGRQVLALLVAGALFALVFYGRRFRKKRQG
ncbi:hypothetical protein [Actinoalloteichus hymeniacidonis]|uniref:Uncharacterized protein n=1 Tax=Actinoalloteichus hymeniacidonis TaxID=340345 RepID=A0AAC9MZL8_9PSEU|nr:hypothetical protein [Actinoalloteichus hymeniacidonis]AOS65548.1 hypothetical protein TL08_23840 [Actinoalloteichus hymeniacidonis]MBB5906364.1 hypothetical protein [Actinoalloteichus hymeniacidonis]